MNEKFPNFEDIFDVWEFFGLKRLDKACFFVYNFLKTTKRLIFLRGGENMELKDLKERICSTVTQEKERIVALGEEIFAHPEVGYCEEYTSGLVRRVLDELEISYAYPLALTGVRATLKGRRSLYNICILGELDAVRCREHPHAASDGAVHACGHHAQIAAMLGAAIGLKKSGVMRELDGDITFMAVPAEEFIDLDFRRQLRDAGKISFFGGKQQLIAEGAFDGIDMAMMLHAQPNELVPKLYTRGHNLGFLSQSVRFLGKAAHGSRPYEGTNALNAASLAILGIHSNRETFLEEDCIRIHPIITKGGDVVNSVPDEVCMDLYVRGSGAQAIRKGADAVARSVFGAAQMIGARAEIESIPGYLPIREDPLLSELMERNAAEWIGEENIVRGEQITGSSDVGDLSRLMPVIQPSIGGFSGTLHGKDFALTDPETAYVLSAKLLSCCAAELLWNGGAAAKEVLEAFVPDMTREEYLDYLKGNG